MKSKVSIIIACLLLVLVTMLPVGCKTLDKADAYDIIQDGIATSLDGVNGDIYYAKLTTVAFDEVGTKTTGIITVNVLADEKDYEIVKNESGGYANLRGVITESEAIGNTEAKTKKTIRYGSYDGGKALKITETGREPTYIPMTDEQFQCGELTSAYSMESLLRVTKELSKDDITLDFAKGTVSQKGKVVTIIFKVTSDYLERFQNINGEPSPFDADYVTIEISYGRVQSIIAYRREPGFESFPDAIAIDYEKYKLEISYRGPKFDFNVDK